MTDDRVAGFVGAQVGSVIVPPYTAMGIERDGKIVAGVIFNHYTGTDVHVTIAGASWTPHVLREVGRYVFGTLGCLRMTAITEQPHVIRIAARLGFQKEGRLRNHFGPDRPGMVLGLIREDWKH